MAAPIASKQASPMLYGTTRLPPRGATSVSFAPRRKSDCSRSSAPATAASSSFATRMAAATRARTAASATRFRLAGRRTRSRPKSRKSVAPTAGSQRSVRIHATELADSLPRRSTVGMSARATSSAAMPTPMTTE